MPTCDADGDEEVECLAPAGATSDGKARAKGKVQKRQPQTGGGAAGFADVSTDDDDDDEEGGGDEEDYNGGGGGLRFAVGDAMSASRPPTTSASAHAARPRIVLVFADATGRWPRRGFFRSVSARSDAPQAAYEAAHQNSDLALGDAHLVECGDNIAPPTPPPTQPPTHAFFYQPTPPAVASLPSPLCVCVLVVLARSARAAYGTPPELDLASLDIALRKVSAYARRVGATVHSPRLPNMGGGNTWYAVERLLRKHSERVATTVYYFKRT